MSVAVFVAILFSICSVYSQDPPECVCVPYYQCRPNGTIITDGEGLIDERLGASCQSCSCEGLDVCCSLLKEETVETRKPNITTVSSCGYSNPEGVAFKAADTDATGALFGEFPWMIRIFENGSYRCGGSLIHPSVVLTAAHCVKIPESTYSIRAGEWDTSNTNELIPHQDRKVSSVKLHEHFNPKNYRNDIALVFLSQALELRPHINLACLVAESGISGNPKCIATGWGNPRFGQKENASVILKKVELPLLENPNCQTLLRETRLGKYYDLHDSFICAGAEKGVDTCTGDGGGPLFCPIENEEDRYVQVGITAWGIDCNDEKVPGVYANVATLRKWIDKQMKEKNLPIGPYQHSK